MANELDFVIRRPRPANANQVGLFDLARRRRQTNAVGTQRDGDHRSSRQSSAQADRLNTAEAVTYAPSLANVADNEPFTQSNPKEFSECELYATISTQTGRTARPQHADIISLPRLRYPETITNQSIGPPSICSRCGKFGPTIRTSTSEITCCMKCARSHSSDTAPHRRPTLPPA